MRRQRRPYLAAGIVLGKWLDYILDLCVCVCVCVCA